jgi:hypothetical protein
MQLEKEYKVYMANLDNLVAERPNEFVLIKDDSIIDVYKSYEDALRIGLGKFGNTPFLVKQINKEEELHFFFHGVAA